MSPGSGGRSSPPSPDGDVNGLAKFLGGASKGFELLTPPSLDEAALVQELSAPAEASLKTSGEFRDTPGESAVLWVAVSRLEGRGLTRSFWGPDRSNPFGPVWFALSWSRAEL